MRLVTALLASALLAGCSGAAEPPRTLAEGRGLTAELPEGWRATDTNLTPGLGDPRQAFAAATYPLRHRPTECAHVPGRALEDLGPHDALVELEERGQGVRAAGRPERFGPSLGGRSEAYACVPRASFREHWFEFGDGGRHFHVRVAFGPQAPADVQEEAWSILDSLRVDPAATPGWRSAG